ncbi:MAG: glycosyltransferase family 2 protein [candidate division WOR-3 bacterium]
MKISIVIVTWNNEADIRNCLNSISCSYKFEIIVVDNASTDSTRQLLRSYSGTTLILNDCNLGYARACNQGILCSRGEYVLLLNPDTILEPSAVDIMSRFLDDHPHVGAVAPRLLNSDGSTQHSVRSLPTVSSCLWEITGLPRLFPSCRSIGRWRLRWFDYGKPAEIEQPMSSCLLVRRQILQALSGFDERFSIFYNDVDLSARMLKAGWKTIYLPQARVVHRRGASTSQAKAKMIWQTHRSLFRYLQKHDTSGLFPLKAVILLPALEVSALVRVLLWYMRRLH